MDAESVFTILRFCDTGNEAYGVMLHDGKPLCLTLERPWRENIPFYSCIPQGEYDALWISSTEKIPYPHYQLLNVPDREGICVHAANKVEELLGCIASGSKFSPLGTGVLESRDALKLFMDRAGKQPRIKIAVRNVIKNL